MRATKISQDQKTNHDPRPEDTENQSNTWMKGKHHRNWMMKGKRTVGCFEDSFLNRDSWNLEKKKHI